MSNPRAGVSCLLVVLAACSSSRGGPPSLISADDAPSEATPTAVQAARSREPGPLHAPSARVMTELIATDVIPSTRDPNVLLVLHEEGLRAIDTTTGAVSWTRRAPRGSGPLTSVAMGRIGIALTHGGRAPRVTISSDELGHVEQEHRLPGAATVTAAGGVIRLSDADGCQQRVMTATGTNPELSRQGWGGTFEHRVGFGGKGHWDECRLPIGAARSDADGSVFVLGVEGGLDGDFDAFEIHRLPSRPAYRPPREPGRPRIVHLSADRYVVSRARDRVVELAAYDRGTGRRLWRVEPAEDPSPDPRAHAVTVRNGMAVVHDGEYFGVDLERGAVVFSGQVREGTLVDDPRPRDASGERLRWSRFTDRHHGERSSRSSACGGGTGYVWLTSRGVAALLTNDEGVVCWDPPSGTPHRWLLGRGVRLARAHETPRAIEIHDGDRRLLALVGDEARLPRFVELPPPWWPHRLLDERRMVVRAEENHWAVLALP